MSETANKVGRRPKNDAILKHTNLLGGFDYLRADYKKQTFPRHSHEEYLIGVIENGIHDVWCRGEWWHASSNVVATFSPDEAHHGGLGDAEAWQQTIFYFPEKLVAEALDDYGGTIKFNQPFHHSPALARRLVRLRHMLESGDDQLLVEQEVLTAILETGKTKAEHESDRQSQGAQELMTVRSFIHDNIDQSFNISTLADIAGLSKRQFMNRFQRYFQIAPYQYVMQARVQKVRDALKHGTGLAEASYVAGFTDQSHMTRNFRSIYGVTPARYVQEAG